jgi:hypothetical protein
MLETETIRVLKWLADRAKSFLRLPRVQRKRTPKLVRIARCC